MAGILMSDVVYSKTTLELICVTQIQIMCTWELFSLKLVFVLAFSLCLKRIQLGYGIQSWNSSY